MAMAITPSDHISDNARTFKEALKEAVPLAVSTNSSTMSGIGPSNLSAVAPAVSGAVAALDKTDFNKTWSAQASSKQAALLRETKTNLDYLHIDSKISPPDSAYQAEHSPTIAQLLNAANAAYTLDPAAPKGLHPFIAKGDHQQLAVVNQVAGMSARVWLSDKRQVIIAYSGTFGGDTRTVNIDQCLGQVMADLPSLAGQVAQVQKDAVRFAEYVVQQAQQQGISSNDVFVTGHSLGGGQAQYVAQQTGLGGASFDGIGIPTSDTAVGHGDNFISFDVYGDVWGSYSSDVQADQPVAPNFTLKGGELHHWGHLIMIGDPKDQVALHQDISATASKGAGAILDNFTKHAPEFHYPGNQAKDLNVALFPWSQDQDAGGKLRGKVFDVAQKSIAQAIKADQERKEYHSSALLP